MKQKHNPRSAEGPACPIPISQYPNILLAHGGGGKLMHQLLNQIVLPEFDNPFLAPRHDGAVFETGTGRWAFTTDSYVIDPLFFPGGDIGTLAVHGTVNDLAMCGARPAYLSAAFILEEGLPMDTFWKIVRSMRRAAEDADVKLVTGDTKVVDHGKGDGIFINTAGLGPIEHNLTLVPASVQPGDRVLLNGDIGRHGMAVMAAREELAFETTIESDCAALSGLVSDLLSSGIAIHCLRDLTRGGLAGALVEIAETAGIRIDVTETAIPVGEQVRGACELLGFDPLYVANEGRFIAFVPSGEADRALGIMKKHPLATQAQIIGEVREAERGLVTLKSRIGAARVVDMLSGEQLPRIC